MRKYFVVLWGINFNAHFIRRQLLTKILNICVTGPHDNNNIPDTASNKNNQPSQPKWQ